jgi:hypothetical protein
MDSLIQYDDLFLYAPSFTLWEEAGSPQLFEGKYVGTAREQDIVFLDKDRTMDALLRPEDYARERKVGVTSGKRRLKQVQDRVYGELLAAVDRNDKGFSSQREFQRVAEQIMKRAWKEVFAAGVRATGIAGRGQGKSGVEFTADDETWLKGAMAHEMRFLNGFVNAVADQDYKMPLSRRTRMYVDALESFYDSARVMGMPATSVFRWTGKRDKRVCESCTYLKEHNPYHKKNLPTTPRSGLTICLTNCRDRLLVRVVSSDEALNVLHGGKTREQHIRKLREIKRQARGGRRKLREDVFYSRESLDGAGCACGD